MPFSVVVPFPPLVGPRSRSADITVTWYSVRVLFFLFLRLFLYDPWDVSLYG